MSLSSNPSAADYIPLFADSCEDAFICHKFYVMSFIYMSHYVLVYALHSLENILGLARFRGLVPKLFLLLYSLYNLICIGISYQNCFHLKYVIIQMWTKWNVLLFNVKKVGRLQRSGKYFHIEKKYYSGEN